jgi:PAS domain S-box-containing protein
MNWFSKEKDVIKPSVSGMLKLVFENTNDIILILNDQKVVTNANDKVLETFNIPLDRILDQKIEKLPFIDFSSDRSKDFLKSLEATAGSEFQEIDALDRYQNKIILEARVGRSDDHYIIVFKELSRPSDSSDVAMGLSFLSETSIRLIELETEQDIYQFAADQLAYLAKPACIFINKKMFVEKLEFQTVAYAISGDRFAAGIKIAGSPVGQVFQASDKAEFTVRRGKISKIDGGIHELSGGKISKPVAVIGEAISGVKSVFNIGFYWKGDIFGNASIITQMRSDKPQNSGIIETFANLVSVALQRRRAEDQLVSTIEALDLEKIKVTREKDKLDIILRRIGDGVIVIDQEKKIILANEAATDILGSAKILNLKFSDALKFVDEKGDKLPDFVDECIRSGEVKRIINKAILVISDEKKIPVDLTVSSLKADVKAVGCAVVFRDATKEREIDRAKSEFVSLASHQLRSPLAAINWYSEMLLDKKAALNKDQMEYVEEISSSSKRMNELVKSLLNVSRLELGTFVVDPKNVDLKETAESVLKELTPKIAEKEMKIEEDIDNIKMNADAQLIRIIIQNLLTNSLKYSPKQSEVKVSVKKKGEAGNSKIVLTVQDHGYGIPKKQQDQIFTKMFRADNVKLKEIEGNGLGLYIIKSIVDNSGGKIWFDSEEGKGTTFTIEYPVSGMAKKSGTKTLS